MTELLKANIKQEGIMGTEDQNKEGEPLIMPIDLREFSQEHYDQINQEN
jgi:hypothetical protein